MGRGLSAVDPSAEYRADPGAHWPLVIVLALLGLLSLAAVVWLAIKPGPFHVSRVLTAIVLAGVGVASATGTRFFWRQLHRRYGLHDSGLQYFDGGRTHEIAWDDVREIYETVSSVRLVGVSVDGPQWRVAIVTTEGVRCEIDKSILGADRLVPVVSAAVNRSLRQRVESMLNGIDGAQFGCVSLSQRGIAVHDPPPIAWWKALQRRIESDVNASVVVPGTYRWHDVEELRIAPASRGDRLSNRTSYNQLEIRVQGKSSPVVICAVPEFPNFALFCHLIEEWQHPLKRESP
jgi:hypothetical protein